MQLTEHFTLAELTESDTATRIGIDNTPPDSLHENLVRTAELGEMIRFVLCSKSDNDIPIVVSSGYRCERLERVLCYGDYEGWCNRRQLEVNDLTWPVYFSHKSHPQGRAIDFRAPAFGDPFHIVRILQQDDGLMAMADQIIMEGVTRTGAGWVHASWSATPRHEVLTAIFDEHGVPRYEHGLT